MAEKRFLCAPRMLFVFQQMFMLIYVIFFLNYFNMDRQSDDEIANSPVLSKLKTRRCLVVSEKRTWTKHPPN
ncbi:hypothetical protein L3Y34_007662 [Caenorhabditis briggsae]|nr:hypothetical protein L3Y34_007662 [Caenorhabditis briggsae]